ncbi:hypothetical protein H6H01_20655 [Nostoc calcicola FACHB-3891]|nr:hypothetical protein [Nostoc calcicola FACHB-3891]MDZ8063673.1 hypothetical protein [Nostoc sp. EkiNYC01]
MAEIQLAIEGEDAIAATEALLEIPGIDAIHRVSGIGGGRFGVNTEVLGFRTCKRSTSTSSQLMRIT